MTVPEMKQVLTLIPKQHRLSPEYASQPRLPAMGTPTQPPEAAGAADNSQFYVLTNSSDVLNVDADDNVNVLTDNGLSALIVGIENYGGVSWDSPDDALVIEDVFLDGVPYTLYFEIPQVVTADITNTTYKTAETDNLPVMCMCTVR